MFLTQFLTVTTITLLAVMSPGPDFAIVTRNSLKYSRNIGYATSLGIALGLMIHITYSLVGIGLIISRSVVLFNIIKLIGAAYLAYIGLQALRSKPNNISTETPQQARSAEITSLAAVKNGFFANALNPKATIFFLALFTEVISPQTTLVVKLFFGGEIMLIAFVWFSLLSYLMTRDGIKNRIIHVQHHVEHVMGAVLIALGIKVALSTK